MKLKEYMKAMRKLIKEHPEANDYDIVYSGDDEGNYFAQVNFHPTIGKHSDEGGFETEVPDPNAVCIN